MKEEGFIVAIRFWIPTFVLACMSAVPAEAQEDSLVQVLTVAIEPGMNAQFEEVVRAYRDASMQEGLENYWLSAQSISGAPVYRFHLERSSWGDLMNPEPDLNAVFGERETERLMNLLNESVASEHVAIYSELDASSHVPSMGFEDPPEGLIYIDFTLNPGTAPMFFEMTEAQKEASVAMYPDNYFGVSAPEFGATGPRTILIVESMSDLDTPTMAPGPRLFEYFGEQEGARLNDLAAQSIVSFESQLFRTRPVLNYQPE